MNDHNTLGKEQKIQEKQFEYPYHYIPNLNNGYFSQTHYWSWGYRYLGGVHIVFQLLDEHNFKSLVDIGCGDGRFLCEVKKKYQDLKLTGIDYSNRAIQLASALNPDISFFHLDITENLIDDTFDVASLIEVLEHIPPCKINTFIESISKILRPKGIFLITVPHKNKAINPKHYQHFSSDELIHLLSPCFNNFRILPFDPFSRVMKILQLAIGGKGEHFIINNQKIMRLFFNYYLKKYLYAADESRCGRIAVSCKKISD